MPSGWTVATWAERGADSGDSVDQPFVVGSKISTPLIEVGAVSVPWAPPQTTTRPSSRRLALCSERACAMLPAVQVLVAAWYTSALAIGVALAAPSRFGTSTPPLISTRLLASVTWL